MDAQLVETLNRWFNSNAFRADLCRAIAIAPPMLIGALMVFAWSTHRSGSPIGRSELLLGVVAAVSALLLNVALGHLYYRARPFLVLDVRPLLPQAVDSSLFSDQRSRELQSRAAREEEVARGARVGPGVSPSALPRPSTCVPSTADFQARLHPRLESSESVTRSVKSVTSSARIPRSACSYGLFCSPWPWLLLSGRTRKASMSKPAV